MAPLPEVLAAADGVKVSLVEAVMAVVGDQVTVWVAWPMVRYHC